ncbi:hypothetical protein SAY86_000969 [Trapa natans]|uniref:Uncharacterized protein n=1 Tax=Trapa natans TaxID=22666 RepID=A0AAN7MFV3_TRANT|nr:hypothetical protein SAY86_000969 [Trapa natans]
MGIFKVGASRRRRLWAVWAILSAIIVPSIIFEVSAGEQRRGVGAVLLMDPVCIILLLENFSSIHHKNLVFHLTKLREEVQYFLMEDVGQEPDSGTLHQQLYPTAKSDRFWQKNSVEFIQNSCQLEAP